MSGERNIEVEIVPPDRALQLKGSSGIPYVEEMAAATAEEYEATVVAVDPDIESVRGVSELLQRGREFWPGGLDSRRNVI